MMNEEQRVYAIKSVEEYRKEENKADRKGFWQLMAANASLILIGLATYLSSPEIGVIPRDIALGSQVFLGVVGLTTFGESIRNNSKSNAAEACANILEEQVNIDVRSEEETKSNAKRK